MVSSAFVDDMNWSILKALISVEELAILAETDK